MNIKPIKTEQDYKEALKHLSWLFDNQPEPGTDKGDYFEIMLTLVEDYEKKHFPISSPDPIEAIKFRMEQSGLTVKDLEPAIGRTNRVYEVLSGKRKLTLNMIRNLHKLFNIPLESLIGTSL
ncbi:MAG: helix-turn-helix domain-containing protein [Enterobacteriaceae bacterium]